MAFCYNVNIRQENEPNLEEFSDNVFKINREFRYILSLNAETTLDIFNQTLVFGRDMFLSDQHHRDIILCMVLDSRASPEFIESAVFPPILRFARDANSNPMNLGLKVINMNVVVEIIVDVNINEEDDINYDDELIDESLMNTEINFTPASRSSIEGLEMVKLDPMTKREDECAICLEEFVKGKEIASMPCGHGYHDGYIIKWLKISHLCPLCRYQMPTLIHL
ncbi:hypothetical protein ERO13_A05G299450v2 [Gossypium hirsutum]|uniref:RING-type E3 ubiquitin transferase n=1 Tax=Gossypium hirsutum TaxID=3635 RepID=A0A1U8PMJ9_GOSHI|nr:probable E3 ubiquitin-protein ligase RHG1A [Gossypium hirsutum]KAG4201779.1 hypothetical protein ERO13_A05G299450v2 [Gossypium hirsutum]